MFARPVSISSRLLAGVVLAGTLSVLDSTIVVPLLTTIGADFGGGSEVSWLVSAYLLASTVTIPIWGRWLDLRGERLPMYTALSVFVVGTVLAAVAPSLGVLILARILQGIGAGGVVPLGQAIIAGRCDQSERARLQIYYNVAYGAAAGLGPLLGGVLVHVSWRWAFVVILPFCAIVWFAMRGQLRDAPPSSAVVRPFDPRGSALITVGLTALLLAIERRWWWLLIFGTASLAWYMIRSRRVPHGPIPRAVLNNRTVIAGSAFGLVIGFVQFAYLTYLPALSLREDPGLNSGLVVVPLTVLWVTLGAFTGILALRVGTRRLTFLSVAFAVAAGLTVLASTTIPMLFLAGTLVGAAAGFALIPVLLLAQHSAPSGDMGAVTSVFVLLRNFGGALGVAVTAVALEDLGVRSTFVMLVAVAAAGLVPALLLPGRPEEQRRRGT